MLFNQLPYLLELLDLLILVFRLIVQDMDDLILAQFTTFFFILTCYNSVIISTFSNRGSPLEPRFPNKSPLTKYFLPRKCIKW